MRLTEKVAIVTGTSAGVGRVIADILLEDSWTVEGCSRRASSIERRGYSHSVVDVGAETSVRDWVRSVEERNGRIDLAINNAGLYKSAPLLTLSTEHARQMMETNFIGTLNVCREAARVMIKNKVGRIVNISSIAATLKDPGTAAYTASKGAVTAFTKVIARELAAFGITCNVIELSIFESEITDSMPEQVTHAVVERLSFKRFADKGDLAAALAVFTSSESRYVTGQVLQLGYCS